MIPSVHLCSLEELGRSLMPVLEGLLNSENVAVEDRQLLNTILMSLHMAQAYGVLAQSKYSFSIINSRQLMEYSWNFASFRLSS